jgi:hypothetical protein
VWPSGTALLRVDTCRTLARALGQRRQVARLLVVRQHRDAPYVPLLAGEGGRQEDVDEVGHVVEGVHPTAHRDHVGVVVLAGQGGGLLAPHQGGPHTLDLVRRDLLAVARATDHDAEAARIGDDRLGGAQAEHRVVVEGVVGERAVVDRLVSLRAEVVDEVPLEVETGVVGAQVDAHGVSVPVTTPSRQRASTLPPWSGASGVARSRWCRRASRSAPW